MPFFFQHTSQLSLLFLPHGLSLILLPYVFYSLLLFSDSGFSFSSVSPETGASSTTGASSDTGASSTTGASSETGASSTTGASSETDASSTTGASSETGC